MRRFYLEGLALGGNILVAPSVIFLSDDNIEGDLCGDSSYCLFGDIYGDF